MLAYGAAARIVEHSSLYFCHYERLRNFFSEQIVDDLRGSFPAGLFHYLADQKGECLFMTRPIIGECLADFPRLPDRPVIR